MTQGAFLLQPAYHQLFPAISEMKKGRVAVHKTFAREQQLLALPVKQLFAIR